MLCVSNWCFCTLLDGKGKLKEIFMVTAYALVPYIIVRFVTVLLSMVMLNDEQILLNYCVLLAQLWGFVMAFTGLSEIHEYGFKKTLLSLVLTAIGVIIMLFISLMLIMLFQQVYKFVTTVAIELAY